MTLLLYFCFPSRYTDYNVKMGHEDYSTITELVLVGFSSCPEMRSSSSTSFCSTCWISLKHIDYHLSHSELHSIDTHVFLHHYHFSQLIFSILVVLKVFFNFVASKKVIYYFCFACKEAIEPFLLAWITLIAHGHLLPMEISAHHECVCAVVLALGA